MKKKPEFDLWDKDCLQVMPQYPAKSVDLVLADLPFGVTHAKWDSMIPFEVLWQNYFRIAKDNAAFVLFGIEPFSSKLRMSMIDHYKYDLIWLKDKPVGFLSAKKRPLSCHEVISVFYRKQSTYNPQMWESKPMNTVRTTGDGTKVYAKYHKMQRGDIRPTARYPLSYLKMNTVNGQAKDKTSHPSQKPVQLLSYLIQTFSNPGDLVMDNTMGSGSTGIAAIECGRRFLGMENNAKYFKEAEERIKNAAKLKTTK